MAVRVSNDTFETEVLHSDGVVVVDFYSDSCVPCKRLSPVLAELEETYESKVKLAKINVNFDMELAQSYKVLSVPSLIFFKDGKEVSRLQGLVKKDEIVSIIENIK